MLDIQFDHDKESLFEVFGVDENTNYRIKMIILFESYSGIIKIDELQSEGEDIYSSEFRVLSTKSGCLERCLEHLSNDAEKALLIFEFLHLHEIICERYTKHTKLPEKIKELIEEINKDDSLDELEKELKLGMLKLVTKKELGKKDNETEKIIKAIKSANYDFHKFLFLYDKNFNVDIMLDDILSKKQQD